MAVYVPCPLRILYIVNCAKTQSTILAKDPLDLHESHLPIVAYYFAYFGQNKSLKVAQIGKQYIPIPQHKCMDDPNEETMPSITMWKLMTSYHLSKNVDMKNI